jgi:hypothetical protein
LTGRSMVPTAIVSGAQQAFASDLSDEQSI